MQLIESTWGKVSLPKRSGPAPQTDRDLPHHQLDQIPNDDIYQSFREVLTAWPNVLKGPSLRAPAGTLGLFLPIEAANGPEEAFMLGTEFAHLHPLPDGSLHLVLPPEFYCQAIEAGWAEPHPLAGKPTISSQIVLIYAPRTQEECDIIVRLVHAAELYARGGGCRGKGEADTTEGSLQSQISAPLTGKAWLAGQDPGMEAIKADPAKF